MAATLRDIRLQIVIDVKNMAALRTLSRSLTDVEKGTNQTSKAFQGQVKTALHPLAQAYRDLTDNLTRTEKAMDAVWRAASHYEQVGRRLIDVSRQIVDIGVNIVKTYADYDYWLRRAAVALNTDVVWQQKLDQAIQDTAKAIGLFSPTEVAEAYNIWGAATGVVVDNQETLAFVTDAVQKVMIATAGAGGTLETNLKGVSAILGIFNLRAEDAGHVTEVLALMTERTQADFGDLINAFTYIGPQAQTMGVRFEDVAQMLGILADAGQRGSRAGRGLSMMLEGLLAPTDAITEKLSEFTLRTQGVARTWEQITFPNGKFAGLESIIRDLSKTYMGMTDQERAWFNARAASNNAIRAMLPLINATIDLWERDASAMAAGTVAMDKQKYSLETASAFFENMKGQMLGSIKAIVGSFQASFFPLLQMIATKIMELAVPVMNRLKGALDTFTEYLKDNPGMVDFIVKAAAMVAGIFAVGGAAFAILGNILSLATAFVMFVSTVLPLVTIFSILGVIITKFVESVQNNTYGVRDAIVRVWIALKKVFDQIADAVVRISDEMRPFFDSLEGIGDTALRMLVDFLNSLADALMRLTDEDIENLIKIAGAFLAFMALRTGLGMIGSVLMTFGGALLFVARVVGTIKGLGIGMTIVRALNATAIVAAVRVLVGGIVAALTFLMAHPVIAAIVAIFAAIALAIAAYENNWGGFRDFVDGIVAWLSENVVPAITGFIEAVVNFVTGVVTAITDAIAWVVETVEGIVEFFQNLPENIANFWNQIVEGVTTFINDVITNITNFLTDLAENWDYYLGYIIGFVLGSLVKFLADIIMWAHDLVVGVIDWVSKLPGRIADWLASVWETLSTWFGQFISDTAAWAGDIIQGIVDWFIALPGHIARWLGDLWATLSGWFSTNVPKVIEFVSDMIGNIIQFFIDLPGNVVDAIANLPTVLKDFFTKVVPKIWTSILNIGKDFVRGIWQGITSLGGWIVQQVEGFINGLIQGAKDALGISSPSRIMAAMGVQMVEGIAQGILKTDDAFKAMQSTTDKLVDLATFGTQGIGIESEVFGASFAQSESKRVIEVHVVVESPDGSLDSVQIDTLADLITGSEMVRAMEHMSTVG